MQTLSSHHIDSRDNQQYTWPRFTNKDLKIPFEIDAGIPLSQNFILIFNFSSIYAICTMLVVYMQFLIECFLLLKFWSTTMQCISLKQKLLWILPFCYWLCFANEFFFVCFLKHCSMSLLYWFKKLCICKTEILNTRMLHKAFLLFHFKSSIFDVRLLENIWQKYLSQRKLHLEQQILFLNRKLSHRMAEIKVSDRNEMLFFFCNIVDLLF